MDTIFLELLILIYTFLFFFIVYCIFAWNTNEWNGIEQEDNTITEKVVNRFYFTLSTSTTVGFGNISPKTIKCKLLVSIQMIVILSEVLLAIINR